MLKVKMRKLEISTQHLKVRTVQMTMKIMSTFRYSERHSWVKIWGWTFNCQHLDS